MFVGHYAPVFALRAVRQSPGLAAGFVAVQLVDIGFFSLSYFGIEKWAANPSIAGCTPVDLYFMPYTHSIAGSALWAVAAGLVFALFAGEGRRLMGGVLIGLLVFSHWLLDLVVHRHDLALGLDGAGEKFGFALWDHPLIVIPLELGMMLGALVLYLNATTPKGLAGRIMPWVVGGLLVAGACVNWFTPPAPDIATFSGMGLAAYLGFAFLALLLDRTRA